MALELEASQQGVTQTGAVAATKVVTGGAHWGAGREELKILVDSRSTATTTTDSVGDTHRWWSTPRGGPGRLVCALRDPSGPGGPPEQLPLPIPHEVLRRPPRQSGDQPTLRSLQSDRTVENDDGNVL